MTLEELTALRGANRVHVPPEMMEAFPDAYAALNSGDCMVPTVRSGDVLLISPSAPLRAGCIVCLFDGTTHYCKQLVQVPRYDRLPAEVTVDDPKPTVLIKEHANPRATLHWRAETLVSIHAVVGYSRQGLEPIRALP